MYCKVHQPCTFNRGLLGIAPVPMAPAMDAVSTPDVVTITRELRMVPETIRADILPG